MPNIDIPMGDKKIAELLTSPSSETGGAARSLATQAVTPEAVESALPTYLSEEELSVTIDDKVLPKLDRTDSPRNTSRVKDERRPILLVDRVSPNATWGDLTLLSVSNSSMYAVGADRTIRSSTDKGATWSKLAQGGAGKYGQEGMFFRTSTAGTIITSWHPDGGGAPTIRRSTNYGATFTDVVAAQTDAHYLGPTNVCQDPVTGYIYMIEYVTVLASVKPTFKIIKSTDNGANWTDFHVFQRDAVAYPTTAVRHGHAIQWDQFGQRIYFLTGDAEAACGIYRIDAAGTGIEPVLRKDSQSVVLNSATAVGIMFFPDYIAWGQDATNDAWLLRMNRNQIGQPNPVLEKIMHVQGCAWYTVRTKVDGTEWLMGISNQHAADVAPLDNSIHLYRVADNGATCDEVGSFPATSTTATNYFYPLDTPLQSNADEYVWIGSNIYNPFESTVTSEPHIGQQLKVLLGWGMNSLIRPDANRKPYAGSPQTVNSGKISLAASATHTFAATRVPNGARKLYVFDMGAWKISGTGTVKVRVWNATGAAAVTDPVAGAIETTSASLLYNTVNNESAPNVFLSGQLTAGNIVYFDLVETAAAGPSDVVGHIQFAWGY